MTQLTGQGPIVVSQNLFDESSVQRHNLGELVQSSDGRAFRYCKAGASALVAGKLQQASVEDTGDQNLALAATAVGASSIVTTGTVTVVENQYAQGFAMISVTPGAGIMYGVSGHAAATAAVFTVNLSDEIQVALTTSSKLDLVKNPFDSVIINPTTQTGQIAGVAVKAITAEYFGWLQVGGPANVLANVALTVGLDVVASDAVAGAVEVIADGAAELLPRVGVAMTGVADTQYGAVNLDLI